MQKRHEEVCGKMHTHIWTDKPYARTQTRFYLRACTWADFGEGRRVHIPAKDALPPTWPLQESASPSLSPARRQNTSAVHNRMLSVGLSVTHLYTAID